MIRLNNSNYEYKEGMTITTLMEEKGYDFFNIVVKINGVAIEEDKWENTPINEGDDVLILHMFAGG